MRSIPCIGLLVSMVIVSHLGAQTPIIDGVFNEWPPATQVATDPQGDNQGAFDLTTVSAMTLSNFLYGVSINSNVDFAYY